MTHRVVEKLSARKFCVEFLPLLWAQNYYTHILIILELISQLHRASVTHRFLAGILLCNPGACEGIFCEGANYTL